MNMKKIMAGVAASALAVTAMTVSASAASEKYQEVYTVSVKASTINTAEEGFWANAMTGAITHGITFEGTYTDAAGATGNILFYPSWDGTGDVGEGKLTMNSTDMWQGVTVNLPETVDTSDLSAITLNFTVTALDIDADAQVQAEAYGEEGNDHVINDMVVAKIGINTPYADGFGSITVQAAATAAPADDKPEEPSEPEAPSEPSAPAPGGTDGAGTDPNKDKPAVDTGIEGVAIVAGLAIIAAGAVVVAKKRG